MRQAVLLVPVFAVLIVLVGCQQQSYTLRYRPGSWYEYEQLVDAWIPNNDTPPPLPPASEPSQAGWVMVPSSDRLYPLYSGLDEYDVYGQPRIVETYQPRIYIGIGASCYRNGAYFMSHYWGHRMWYPWPHYGWYHGW
jgi:hypothetical protein